MGKSASSLSNMVITLLVITAVAGGSLGFVYRLTKDPIAQASMAKQQEAIKLVVPGFDNDPAAEMYEIESEEGFNLKVFPAKEGEELVGVAIETMSNKGFGGDIKIMVGLKPDGTVIDYQVLSHKETPGLGTKMVDWFKPHAAEGGERNAFFDWLYGIKSGGGNSDGNSVIGKNPKTTNFTVSKDGGDIDAITAATISSRAFLDAVCIAYKTYTKHADGYSSATTQVSHEEGGEQ